MFNVNRSFYFRVLYLVVRNLWQLAISAPSISTEKPTEVSIRGLPVGSRHAWPQRSSWAREYHFGEDVFVARRIGIIIVQHLYLNRDIWLQAIRHWANCLQIVQLVLEWSNSRMLIIYCWIALDGQIYLPSSTRPLEFFPSLKERGFQFAFLPLLSCFLSQVTSLLVTASISKPPFSPLAVSLPSTSWPRSKIVPLKILLLKTYTGISSTIALYLPVDYSQSAFS